MINGVPGQPPDMENLDPSGVTAPPPPAGKHEDRYGDGQDDQALASAAFEAGVPGAANLQDQPVGEKLDAVQTGDEPAVGNTDVLEHAVATNTLDGLPDRVNAADLKRAEQFGDGGPNISGVVTQYGPNVQRTHAQPHPKTKEYADWIRTAQSGGWDYDKVVDRYVAENGDADVRQAFEDGIALGRTY